MTNDNKNNNQQQGGNFVLVQRQAQANNGNQLSFRDYIDMFFFNWHWFALSVFACLSLAVVYLNITPPTYQRQAVMLVKDDKSAGKSQELQALSELSGASISNSVDNEVYILRSFMLMQEVVKRLHLNVNYTVKDGWLNNRTLYYDSPVTVWTDTDPTSGISMKMKLIDENQVQVYDVRYNGEKMEMNEVIAIGDTVQTPVGNLIVDIQENSPYTDKEILVSIGNIENTTNAMLSKLTTGLLDKKSTLVQLTFKEGNIARADAVLNMLLKVYSENIVEDKNSIAAATANFIDTRVQIIAKELGDVETRLTEFKQQNQLVNLQANSQIYLQEGSKAKDETVKLEAELTVAQYLRDYLQDVTNQYELIPNVSSEDASLSGEVNAYNQKMMQRNRLVQNSGETNAVVQDLNTELNALRSSIKGSLQSNINALELKLKKSRSVQGQAASNIQNIPAQEKYALDVERQQKIKETLYTMLLEKREDNNLQLAITEANIRMVEAPFGSRSPIAPIGSKILLIAFVIGFALPYGAFFIKDLIDTKIRSSKEIEEKTSLTVLGELPNAKTGEIKSKADIAVSAESKSELSEAFRMLRTNLRYAGKNAKVIMFTSTLAGEGKSFICRNLAAMLAMTGNRVVLVDCDIRKRTQSRLLGLKRQEHGLTSYLGEIDNDIDQIILKNAIGGCVDLIPVGPNAPNSSELLMSDTYETLIETLKKQYDIVMLDAVPARAIADATIAARMADITLYVMNVDLIDRRFLPELERLHKEQKFPKMYVVLNSIDTFKKRYGYGYGHGYGYGYGYGDDSRKKKSLWRRIKKRLHRGGNL